MIPERELRDRFAVHPSIDVAAIQYVAAVTAELLANGNWPILASLTPGDATIYHVLIATKWEAVAAGDEPKFASGADTIVSLLNLSGMSYPWNRQSTTAGYVLDHWVRGTDTTAMHTANILAVFLTALASEMNQ